MKLYDSMIEGEEHSTTYKGAIQHALINFQIGLRDELKYSFDRKDTLRSKKQ